MGKLKVRFPIDKRMYVLYNNTRTDVCEHVFA